MHYGMPDPPLRRCVTKTQEEGIGPRALKPPKRCLAQTTANLARRFGKHAPGCGTSKAQIFKKQNAGLFFGAAALQGWFGFRAVLVVLTVASRAGRAGRACRAACASRASSAGRAGRVLLISLKKYSKKKHPQKKVPARKKPIS